MAERLISWLSRPFRILRQALGSTRGIAATLVMMGSFSSVLPPAAGATAGEIIAQGASRQRIELPNGALASLPSVATVSGSKPRLIVLLHGAGQTPDDMLARFSDDPDCADAVLLAPKSLHRTWDVISMAETSALEMAKLSGDYLGYTTSPDGERVVLAMRALEERLTTDPAHRILLGFSDGATFALAIGTSSKLPFTDVVVLSPGLDAISTRPVRGRRVLVMHGRQDRSLPYSFTSTTIVNHLKSAGLLTHFEPFEGGHVIPDRPIGALERSFGSSH